MTQQAPSTIDCLTLQADDPAAAASFYAALGLDGRVRVRPAQEPTTGFRGFTVSLLVSQPSTVDALVALALEAGGTGLKPVKKSFWGYGGVVAAPDGAIWKVATSAKKDSGPAERRIDDIVLLLGSADVAASKRFYVEKGLEVGKSFGSRYVEFAMPSSAIKLALYRRKGLAKDAGVPADGSGSHRLVIGGSGGSFADPDGFSWEPAAVAAPVRAAA